MNALPQRVELVPIGRMLDGISDGGVVLPEFQREYVWSNRDARALVATVLQGWPAGSLLLMEGTPAEFGIRPFEGQTSARLNPELVVLDGQQRLTALFHALHDTGPYRFFLDLDLLAEASGGAGLPDADPEDVETCIVVVRRGPSQPGQPTLPGFGLGRLPLSALRSASAFYSWAGQRPEHEPALSRLYRSTLSGVHAYEFPCVYLDRGIDVGVIARIFERLNRSGLRLAAFDLAVARAFKDGWNLRAEWARACDESPGLAEYFGDDGLITLQVISLVHQRDVRQTAVLRLDPDVLRDKWEASTRAVAATVEFLRMRCGVLERRWLPYRAAVLVLAGVALASREQHFPAAAEQWFWATSFGQRFDVAANTRVVSEFTRLQHALAKSDDAPAVEVDLDAVWHGTRRGNSALMRAFTCAVAQQLGEAGLLEPDARPPRVERFLGRSAWSTSDWDERLYDRVLNHVLVPAFERYDRDALAPKWVSQQWILDRQPSSSEEFFSERLTGLSAFLHKRGVVGTSESAH